MNNKGLNWVLLVVSGSDKEMSVSRDEKGFSSAFCPINHKTVLESLLPAFWVSAVSA